MRAVCLPWIACIASPPKAKPIVRSIASGAPAYRIGQRPGLPGSIAKNPSRLPQKPVTRQPRSIAGSVTKRTQGFRAGTSPPSARMPMCMRVCVAAADSIG